MPTLSTLLRSRHPRSPSLCKLASTVLPVLLLIVGCTSGDPSGEMTLEEFIAARYNAQCEFYARCSDHIHAVYPSNVGLGLSEGCLAFMGGDPELEALFARGHTKVDAQEAERCFKATAACESSNVCELSLVGTLAEGEPCSSNFECSSRRCEGGSEASCGQCGPASVPAKLGEPCSRNVGCEQSGKAFVGCFNGEGTESLCAAVRTVSVGESCTAAGDVCEGDAYCHPDGTCRSPVATGQACSDGDRCVRGSLCSKAGAGDGSSRTCIAVVLRAEGETCTDEFDLAADGTFHVCDMSVGQRCDDATRTCTTFSRVGSGESCGGSLRCDDGLFCNEAAQCSPLLTLGQPCRANPHCESQRCEGTVCVATETPVCP